MDFIKKYYQHGVFRIPRVSSFLPVADFDHIYWTVESPMFPQNFFIQMTRVRCVEPLVTVAIGRDIPDGVEKMKVNLYLRLVNRDKAKSKVYNIDMELEAEANIYKETFRVTELMREGWLTNDVLTYEYGSYMYATQEIDGVWKFNFWDPIFDSDERQHMITLKADRKSLYTHKQLLTFHSLKYSTVPHDWNIVDQYNFNVEKMEICLQLAHGVRISLKSNLASNKLKSIVKVSESKLKSIISIARSKKLYNVVHYCQYQLMTFEGTVENLKFAFEFNTRHYSIHLMKKLESREELKEILKGMDIQMMSGESMKQCARFFFDGKI